MSAEMIILLHGGDGGGGVTGGGIDPPVTAEYTLDPDGNIMINPDGEQVEEF